MPWLNLREELSDLFDEAACLGGRAWDATAERIYRYSYAANRERFATYWASYYAANRERLCARSRATSAQYYAENRERVRERCRAYYRANSERICKKQRAWRAANGEKARAYYSANADRIRAQRRARDAARKAEGVGT